MKNSSLAGAAVVLACPLLLLQLLHPLLHGQFLQYARASPVAAGFSTAQMGPVQYITFDDEGDESVANNVGLADKLAAAADVPVADPLTYHNGSLMTEPIHVYIVLYGSHEPAVAINIERFVDGLFASDLWGVTRTFYQPINGTNVPISGRIVLKDIWTDNYTVGRSLTVYSFAGVVLNAIYTHRSKPDPNGMYIVYAAPDVSVAGFCTQFCGARTSFFQLDVPDPVRMPFAVVGDASTCPRCVAPMWRNDSKTITGNIHADTPIPFISGLIPAIATDRFNDGWFDSLRRGISNKCGGLIPNLQYRDSVAYNLELDGNLFLVPALWDNMSQNCSIARKQHVRY